MSTMEQKKYDDSAIDTYVSTHNVYESTDIGLDIPAIIQYAREHNIPLSAVPQEIIRQHTYRPPQLVD